MDPKALDEAFLEAVRRLETGTHARDLEAPLAARSRLTGKQALALFESQVESRHLDFAARFLREKNQGFYTIGSSGHESNAVVAAATRVTDPALLHYRSGAFFCERARANPGRADAVRDVLLGLLGAKDEPIAGGRHKVFGSKALEIIPQTSTIASHLPRAVGLAFAIERSKRLGVSCPYPESAIVLASFGDASANHSTLTGAINTTCRSAHQQLPMPILFVCEDNGIGISVETPSGWIRSAYGARAELRYFDAEGADLQGAFDAACAAADYVRETRRPAFLHLRVVRLMGHAGSDAELGYRTPELLREEMKRDPLLGSARQLVALGVALPAELIGIYEAKRYLVMEAAQSLLGSARLTSVADITAPLAPRSDSAIYDEATRAPEETKRLAAHGAELPEALPSHTLAMAINRALTDICVKYPEAIVFGEDVGRKGGVYGVTKGLIKRFGAGRVFDTVLDEQSILGLGLGAALAGLLPIPEIQYLAYLHNAEDQLRGEAASLRFFSQGQYQNPLVTRIAGFAYQKGFGGHFHNDNAVGVLRDIPGLVIAAPARADDAAPMLRTCVAAAKRCGSVSVFLEPIALYHTRDLHEPGDSGWLGSYAAPADWGFVHAPIGRGRTYGDGADLTIISFANGLHMSLRVQARLAKQGIHARVLDLRWLAPLPVEDILREARATGRVLVVDETRKSGGVSEGVIASLVDARFDGAISRVTSLDSFIPLGDAALLVLVSEQAIERAAFAVLG